MASETAGRGFWRDDEIVVDKDGIPHYTGAQPGLMREYRKRVLFAYQSLEGSGDDEEKEKKSLQKKQTRFAKKLVDGLHGEAWRACQDLVSRPEELKTPDGYKKVFAALQQIEKVSVIKATEAFDTYFEKCHRRRGEAIDHYLRRRRQDWADLQDLADNNVNLPRDDRRQILLACQSSYSEEAIEKALRVSYYDYHEKERTTTRDWHGPPRRSGKGFPSQKGQRKPHYANAVLEEDMDPEDQDADEHEPEDYPNEVFAATGGTDDGEEDEHFSDAGASGDDEIYEAFASYQESRKKLREVQKARGFLKGKGGGSPDDRKAAIAREKARTRCSACGRLGHWAGDDVCGKGGASSPSKGKGGRSPSRKGGRGSKGKAYLVGDSPLYFSLNDGDEDGYCDMILDTPTEMDQDDGNSELDEKRKHPMPKARPEARASTTAEWEFVSEVPPFPFETDGPDYHEAPFATSPVKDRSQHVIMPVKTEDIEVHTVKSFAETMPVDLEGMIVRDLQGDCDRWGIQTSGTKAELISRLQQLYRGGLVLRKGCSKRWVQLKEHEGSLIPEGARGYAASSVAGPEGPGRIFRPYVPGTKDTRSTAPSAAAKKKGDEKKVCPRSGLEIPSSLAVGEVVPQIGCLVCKCPLVFRQRLDKTGYFFGCRNFVTAKALPLHAGST
ncbi:GIP [Symbiodinium sp. CCMP2456]|nr:GIP [Symbiodinium sp. CCMP2456]